MVVITISSSSSATSSSSFMRSFFFRVFLVSCALICRLAAPLSSSSSSSSCPSCVRQHFVAAAHSVTLPSSAISSSLPPVDISKLHPREIAILQYDSRSPLANYWLASALWNKQYCDRHGHRFIYYVTPFTTAKDQQWCMERGQLAAAWCKVKAMVQANEDFPEIKLFLYMDSDAVIDARFEEHSLNDILSRMQSKLDWNPNERPVVFNQDGPCWWCSLIKRIGYTMCLNAGTVVWYNSELGVQVLRAWWEARNDSYETNPIKRKFRIKWPWEQDRQMALYNRSSHLIQVASQPNQPLMDMKRGHKDWCLSHLPEAGCFVSHFCANAHSKQVMMKKYSTRAGEGDVISDNVAVNITFKIYTLT